MSSSREGSPDWLRSFQTPIRPVVTLSSDSDPGSPSSTPANVDPDEPYGHLSPTQTPEPVPVHGDDDDPAVIKSTRAGVQEEDEIIEEGNGFDVEAGAEEVLEKPIEPPHVSSNLPLVFSEKVQRTKVLVECDGDSIDLSGDVGSVGRVVISNAPTGNHDMLLDLKGTIYKSTIVPSRTFCVVSFNQTEAKIEAIMNDFVQLKPLSNVFEAETMIEGTLDGFSFDSEDEGEKMPKASVHQSNQNNENEIPTDLKTKGRARKTLGVTKKKGKPAAKPPKKTARKPPQKKLKSGKK
ncbi:DNA-binding protein BIN4 [Acorus gramineus]|uniref:DNA-binding protein BIN4 n=1 Tax=Acorus gramineus TaxID=55184 RepID=A0AAV9BJJ3_ACOGR|nr:DNA-binding protein BIN4 [Acorus gramineus]